MSGPPPSTTPFEEGVKKRSPLRVVLFGCAIVVLISGLCIGGLFTTLWKGKGELDAALDEFERPLLAGDYGGAYGVTHPSLQADNTLQEFTDTLKPLLEGAGPRLDRTMTSFNIESNTGQKKTATASYVIKHQNKSGTLEVEFRKDNETLKVFSWYVRF